jgi:CubicO group peptidase (beta-lactamase class C family)
MMEVRKTLVILLLICWTLTCRGQLPRAKPEEVGLSSQRLNRLQERMKQYIKDGEAAGIVTFVIRDGKVAHLGSYGKLDIEKGTPMPKDAIFRIASQSKAIISVGVMILYEEGRLTLNDLISLYIPEFSNMQVAVRDSSQSGYKLVPANRSITIKDLLTHTSGISYGDGNVAKMYKDANLHGWFLANKKEPIEYWMKKLATLPLSCQPGEKWVYGFSTDLLGYLIEKVSGMTLADFIRTYITEPLGMNDTYFFLPEEKLAKFTSVYGINERGLLELTESAEMSPYYRGPRICYSGGAGMLSTAEDYGRFLEMLRRGGELDGVRILSPKTVQLMTVHQIGKLTGYKGNGFGLGFSITQDLALSGESGSTGSFGWGGAYCTNYLVDPAEKMVALFMVQLLPSANFNGDSVFKNMVYQSIIKSYQTGN